jgi:hypothetical protein
MQMNNVHFRMKTKLSQLLIALMFIINSHISYSQSISKLDDLRTRYNNAKQNAIEPINKVYENELRNLLVDANKRNSIDEINKITDELNALVASKPETENVYNTNWFFIFKGVWVSNLGTTFKFKKDGTGEKTYFKDRSSFTWKEIEDKVIQINDNGNLRYFKFNDKKSGRYGESKDALDKTITQKQ